MFESSVISNPSQAGTGAGDTAPGFESSVISNPSQAVIDARASFAVFESSVISNPSQAKSSWYSAPNWFESSVISNPSQTTMTTPDRLTKNEITNAHRRGGFCSNIYLSIKTPVASFLFAFSMTAQNSMPGERRDSLRAASYFRCVARRKEVALFFTYAAHVWSDYNIWLSRLGIIFLLSVNISLRISFTATCYTYANRKNNL